MEETNNPTQHRRYGLCEWKKSQAKDPWWAFIYVGGDVNAAEMVCRRAAFPSGLCVTIEPVKYIFGGGTEDGVRIGMIQYPPFPEQIFVLMEKAEALGKEVAEASCQFSYSIVTAGNNYYYSRRA